MSEHLDPVEAALAEITVGQAVVIVDDQASGEGDLVFAAECASADLVAFAVRFGSGYVCVGMTEADTGRLDLPTAQRINQRKDGASHTVTVDAREGISRGISALDRTRTIRLLADRNTRAGDLSRPGDVGPLRTQDGGVLRRPGRGEAAVDLANLAGLRPVAVLCGIISQANPVARAQGQELRGFADAHGLTIVAISDLISYRRRFDKLITRAASARVPMAEGEFTAVCYESLHDEREHVAFVHGDIGDGEDVLVSMHVECLAGDVFGSLRCTCRNASTPLSLRLAARIAA